MSALAGGMFGRKLDLGGEQPFAQRRDSSDAGTAQLDCFAYAVPPPQGRDSSVSNFGRERRTTEALAFAAGARKTSIHTSNDQLALELGKHAEHLKHCAACGRGGVQGLRVNVEPGARIADGLQDLDQMLK